MTTPCEINEQYVCAFGNQLVIKTATNHSKDCDDNMDDYTKTSQQGIPYLNDLSGDTQYNCNINEACKINEHCASGNCVNERCHP